MASYLQGVQDTVQGLNPPQSNLQFDAQLLQTRQSKYDQSHSKLSKMYGTILNAGLTREDNIEAREEFFKLIDGDLHQIAGTDLSLDSNVSRAQGVFQQIYTNDYLVKDMVWTKNYQNEMQRSDGFRNCVDSEECGGQYWEDGVKYMQYKREEFRSASRDDSMATADVRYIPYNNVMAKALEDFKEMGGFDVSGEPRLTPDGKYMVKVTNGTQSIEPLTAMFSKLYQNNPEFHDMYKVMAYNGRKDEVYRSVQSGEFNSVAEAEVGWIENRRDDLEEQFNDMSKTITHDYDKLKELALAYEDDAKNRRIARGSKEEAKMLEVNELYQRSSQLKEYNDLVKSAQKNMHSQQSMNNITGYLDDVQSQLLLRDEIREVATTLAFKDYNVEKEADKYGVMKQQHSYDVDMENRKFNHEKEIAKIKAKDPQFRHNAIEEAGKLNDEILALDAFNPIYEAVAEVARMNNHGAEWHIPLDADMDRFKAFLIEPGVTESEISNLQDQLKLKIAEKIKMKSHLNTTALTVIDNQLRGDWDSKIEVKIYPDLLTPLQVEMLADATENMNETQEAFYMNQLFESPQAVSYLDAADERLNPVRTTFTNYYKPVSMQPFTGVLDYK